jgi:hypothetical protein
MPSRLRELSQKVGEWTLELIYMSFVTGLIAWGYQVWTTDGSPTRFLIVVLLFVAVVSVLAIYLLRQQPWLLRSWTRYRADERELLERLSRHSGRLYFTFSLAGISNSIGNTLDNMLWSWHVKTGALLTLVVAGDSRTGDNERKAAIESICVNRGEYIEILPGEPTKTLIKISHDATTSDSVKQFAREWLTRIKAED